MPSRPWFLRAIMSRDEDTQNAQESIAVNAREHEKTRKSRRDAHSQKESMPRRQHDSVASELKFGARRRDARDYRNFKVEHARANRRVGTRCPWRHFRLCYLGTKQVESSSISSAVVFVREALRFTRVSRATRYYRDCYARMSLT